MHSGASDAVPVISSSSSALECALLAARTDPGGRNASWEVSARDVADSGELPLLLRLCSHDDAAVAESAAAVCCAVARLDGGAIASQPEAVAALRWFKSNGDGNTPLLQRVLGIFSGR